MKFTTLLRKLILEDSRVKILYDKIVKPQKDLSQPDKKNSQGHMDFETFKTIILGDPTTKIPQGMDPSSITEKNMEVMKAGQYSQWLLKNFLTPKLPEDHPLNVLDRQSGQYKSALKQFKDLFLEDLYSLKENLELFEKAKRYLPQEQRDINKFTPRTLFNLLLNFQFPKEKQAEKEKKEAKKSRKGFEHKGGKIVFESPNWTVIEISDQGTLGQDAAIYYGGFQKPREGESNWCTSGPGLTHFFNYIKKGPLYVIFPNDDKGQVGQRTGLPTERYQFHFESGQYMDREDHQIKFVEMFNDKFAELKGFFQPMIRKLFLKDTPQGGSRVDINYPSDESSKYIAIYGFEELFKNLPKNIEVFVFNNNSKEKMMIDIPDDIGKFKSLKTILLKSVVRSLPESISELPKLSFLSLPDNPELKELPKNLDKVKTLQFLNINGSGIKELPKNMKENWYEAKPGVYATTQLK